MYRFGGKPVYYNEDGTISSVPKASQSNTFFWDIPGNGDLDPLILIHGMASTSNDWVTIIPKCIAKFSRIIMVDLPGHGKSSRFDHTENHITREERVNNHLIAAVDLILDCDDSKYIILGNSMGGYFAVKMAIDNPRCSSLILSSPAGNTQSDVALTEMKNAFCDPNTTIYKSLIMYDHCCGDLKPMPQRVVGGVMSYMRFTEDEFIETNLLLFDAIESGSGILTEDCLKSVTVNTLILWGGQDTLMDHTVQLNLFTKIPNHQIIIQKEFGHTPMMDHPGMFVDVIGDWLDTIKVSIDKLEPELEPGNCAL